VKAQSCANGSVQWNHIAKEEAALPTVGLESVFATAAIDEKNIEKLLQSTFLGPSFTPPTRIMW
jgi:hypothetical protein